MSAPSMKKSRELQIPSGWSELTFAQFVSIQRGHDLPTQDRRPGRVPIMGSFGRTGWHDEARVTGPGITIGRSGASFGTVAMCVEDFWPLNTALYVTDFKGNDVRFCYYLLKGIDFQAFNSGSAQPSLNRNYISNIPLVVPPPAEQSAIAEVIGALDDKIEANRKMGETLEALARTLFKSWFIDFDPVRAKMEGDGSSTSADLSALFPDNLRASSLGQIPEGWTVATLGSLATLVRSTTDPQRLGDVEVAHFSIPAFDAGKMPAREPATSIASIKSSVTPGQVLFSKLNPETSRVWPVVSDEMAPMLASTEFVVWQPGPQVSQLWLWLFLMSPEFRTMAAGMVTGTSNSHQRVQPAALQAMEVPLPPPEVREAFDTLCLPMLHSVVSARQQSATLANLRDTLLPRLLSGDLRVRDAEALAGAAGA